MLPEIYRCSKYSKYCYQCTLKRCTLSPYLSSEYGDMGKVNEKVIILMLTADFSRENSLKSLAPLMIQTFQIALEFCF